MPRIGLSDFIEVVGRSAQSKVTKVREVKHRPPYVPATDFYKPLRDAICDGHKQGLGRAHLQQFMSQLSDPRKHANYSAIVAGYRKWWGRKTLQWFDPPGGVFTHSSVDVSVNPELGLDSSGQLHVIKLYLKGDPLSKARANIATCLMEQTLRSSVPAGAVLGILDARNARLFPSCAVTQQQLAMLKAELIYIGGVWPLI